MAEIKPFQALVFNKDKVNGDFSSVVAPPYDVISDSMREDLYDKSENNIIRLILGKSSENDDSSNNKYTRARKFFDKWQEEEVLIKDDLNAFYVYEQEYQAKGKTCKRIGFFGALKIDETPKETVLPHEYTLSKPKEDRLNLIKEVKGNLSPIFTLFNDSGHIVTDLLKKCTYESDPFINITIDGVTHKVWRLTDEKSIKIISNELRNKKVFIADGHHRYEVATTYRNLRRKDPDYDGSADYIMMYFADMSVKDNLTVFPTHRVVKEISIKDDEDFITKIQGYFNVTKYDDLESLLKGLDEAFKETHAFGYYGGNKYILIKSKDEDKLLSLINVNKSIEWKKLDVSVLHSAVLENLLQFPSKEGNLTYVKNAKDGEELVKSGSHKAAFFLNPTKVEQLQAVAELGEMMPQKSTYFYPKLLTGLVINKFEESKAKTEAHSA